MVAIGTSRIDPRHAAAASASTQMSAAAVARHGAVSVWQQAAAALLASAALLTGTPAIAENELAAVAGGTFHSDMVQPECFATSCKAATKACADNGDCVKGLACTAKCMGDAQCTVGCFARYGNHVLDEMLSCSIEDAGCIKIAIVEPGADSSLDAPLPPKALVPTTPSSMSGRWYKVMGWNPNYDCFECQRNSFSKPSASVVSADIGSKSMDVEVEYQMPRQRSGMPADSFRSTLHESLQFDSTPGSRRTAHTEGKMFGLTFWENWYVIGQNSKQEAPFRFVYYTGKTLQNRYEGAFVYARKPELPASAMPHIYRLAREAGMEPTNFCAVDNNCFGAPSDQSAQPPPFTPVASAAEAAEAPPEEQSTQPLSPLRQSLRDVQELLEDPRPFGREIFSRQRPMKEIREFDFSGNRLPSAEYQTLR